VLKQNYKVQFPCQQTIVELPATNYMEKAGRQKPSALQPFMSLLATTTSAGQRQPFQIVHKRDLNQSGFLIFHHI
jgi:hypothetical protein